MRSYLKQYLDNLRQISELHLPTPPRGLAEEDYYEERLRCSRRIKALMQVNMDLLRTRLIPLLDDLMSASPDDIGSLREFASWLVAGNEQTDNGLHYLICNALIPFARRTHDRDLLIWALYQTAMSLFHFQTMIDCVHLDWYRWRMRMLFGEAAGFLGHYDEIGDMETRGYIHRAMGNLALCYTGSTDQDAEGKLLALRRSLQILTSPEYHKKSPGLPWDLYIYKTHQERTTLLSYLRSGHPSQQALSEVMESAEYVYSRQMRQAKERGVPLQPQWRYAYCAATYHCGFSTLDEFLTDLESIYLSASATDYTQHGLYGNIYIPAIYSNYLQSRDGYVDRKKRVLTVMYQRLMRYVAAAPNNSWSGTLFFYLRGLLSNFVEYPDGILLKDYILTLIAARHPGTYVHSHMVAWLTAELLEKAVEEMPETLVGVRSCADAGEVVRRREEICHFGYECGLLHDIGMLYFMGLITSVSRRWTEEERNIFQLHPTAGYEVLSRCPSTSDYAGAILGHHRWYDGTRGYPADYDRAANPDAAITDLISIADQLDAGTDENHYTFEPSVPFGEMMERIAAGSGTRYAPRFVELALRHQTELERLLAEKRREAYRTVWRLTRLDA